MSSRDGGHQATTISVEVAFAEPQLQRVIALDVAVGTTVKQAIEAANISRDYPRVLIDPTLVGVWNKRREMDFVLNNGDRVEIYRPLIADPKEERRARAAQTSTKKR